MRFEHERPWKFVLLALLPIILVAGLFLWSVRYTFVFKGFKVEFAVSVAYAQQNDCLRAVSGRDDTAHHPQRQFRLYGSYEQRFCRI